MSQRTRWKNRGRQPGPSYIQVPHFVMDSPQWAAMDAFALKLLFELARQYKGNNNGDLSATVESMKERGWRSKDTLPAKLRHLEANGWIVKTRQGGRHIGCNLYAVTWWPIDACDNHQHPQESKPSHAWKNAIGTPPDGERNPVSRGAKALAPRHTGSKPVRLRPAA